jgi:hypothetical protein
MTRTLIVKSTIAATGTLLLGFMSAIHSAAAAQDGAADAHVHARQLLQHADIMIASTASVASHISKTDVLDAHESARRLLAGSDADAPDIATAVTVLANAEPAIVDAHLRAERLLQNPSRD